jgi:nucleoside-diphosphate-sugar epimerase
MAAIDASKHEKALITGAGGFLGQAIARQLLDRRIAVTGFSRNRYPALDNWNVHQIEGDILDAKAVDAACKDMDVVFHTAAKAGVWGNYAGYYQTNVVGTKNVIDACKKNKVGRLIYTSSASVIYNGRNMTGLDESTPYPEKYLTHYPKTKAMAERLVVAAAGPDLRVLILRPHLIWGPGDNHLGPRIIQRADQLARVGKGDNIADTIYIDNAALAHVLAADQLLSRPELSGKIYFISQDDKVPVWTMVNSILAAAGKPPVTRHIPAWLAYGMGAFLEFFYTIFRISGEPRMTRFVAKELSTSHWYDISAAKKDLGYHPAISTPEGLTRLAGWLQRNPGAAGGD